MSQDLFPLSVAFTFAQDLRLMMTESVCCTMSSAAHPKDSQWVYGLDSVMAYPWVKITSHAPWTLWTLWQWVACQFLNNHVKRHTLWLWKRCSRRLKSLAITLTFGVSSTVCAQRTKSANYLNIVNDQVIYIDFSLLIKFESFQLLKVCFREHRSHMDWPIESKP